MDISNAFIQTKIPPNKYGEERLIMKIIGVLVDMLVKLDRETYRNHVVFENGRKVIYVVVLKSIYGILVAALLFYNKFHGDLQNIGFELNTYDPCVDSRIKVGKKHTVRFHVDGVMHSHLNTKVNDKFK